MIDSKKYLGNKTLARLKMRLSEQTSCRLADGTIGTKSKTGRIVLYTTHGRRINSPLRIVK